MMSKKQYEDRKAELEKEFREKLNLLAKTYAAENNPYRIGEPIRDVGMRTISVWLYSGVTTPMKLDVQPIQK